jgi:hypothetical protein
MNRRMFGITSLGALAAAFTPTLIAETPRVVSSKEPAFAKPESPELKRLKEVLDSGTFKPGWGFDDVRTVSFTSGKTSAPAVSFLIYTPHGSSKWGRKTDIVSELLKDPAFQTANYINHLIDRLTEQRIYQGYTAA